MTAAEIGFDEKCAQIRLVITDVDGVMTDADMFYYEDQTKVKKFSMRDSSGVWLMKRAGIRMGIITGDNTEMTIKRAKVIGMDFMFHSAFDKLACMEKYINENGYHADEVAYVGDDLNDYCLLGRVGLFFTVANGNELIKNKADFILQTKGGQGALREMAYILLTRQGNLEKLLNDYIAMLAKKTKDDNAMGEFISFR